MFALRRRYPQIYGSDEKLKLDVDSIRIEAVDFYKALKVICCIFFAENVDCMWEIAFKGYLTIFCFVIVLFFALLLKVLLQTMMH